MSVAWRANIRYCIGIFPELCKLANKMKHNSQMTSLLLPVSVMTTYFSLVLELVILR